jgi:chaperonin GroES
MANIEMFGKRVLIQPVEQQKETASGLIVPVNDNYRPEQGLVIAVGPEVKTLQVNDQILYGKYSGAQVTLDSKPYFILHEEDVYGRFSNAKVAVGVL